jgi:hypothetical protein
MPAPKRPKRNTGPWSPARILDSSSPIVKADVHGFLITAILAWNSGDDDYTEDEKRAIINSLPPACRKHETDENGRLKCPLSSEFVLEDSFLRRAANKFKTDVSDGCYVRSWQNQARKAMQERRDGKFDAYLQAYAEENFGEGNGEDETDGSADELAMSSDGDWKAQGKAGKVTAVNGAGGEGGQPLRSTRRKRKL